MYSPKVSWVGSLVKIVGFFCHWAHTNMGAGKSRLAVQTEAGISATQYYGLKRRYLSAGLANALEERARSGQPPKATAALEAKITSLACNDAPAGAARWTLSLLNERLVWLEYVATISDETIRKVLKKVN
ncbi:MAG: helix-turn-helix domain-containing protein [Hymenobacter sp.]|nr:MAG: helix-turn-helix domain-containing protein [Hymenobacter sp.]